MQKSTKYFLIVTTLFIVMFVTAITGLLVWFIFPFNTGHDEVSLLLEEIHKYASITLATVCVYHFMAHWEWFKKTFKNLLR